MSRYAGRYLFISHASFSLAGESGEPCSKLNFGVSWKPLVYDWILILLSKGVAIGAQAGRSVNFFQVALTWQSNKTRGKGHLFQMHSSLFAP